jgi:hypothetical protein
VSELRKGYDSRDERSFAERARSWIPRSAELLDRYEPEVHLWITVWWLLAIIPTLVWWKNSVLWVALMSLWANIASHWSAHVGAKASRRLRLEQEKNEANRKVRWKASRHSPCSTVLRLGTPASRTASHLNAVRNDGRRNGTRSTGWARTYGRPSKAS